MYRSSINSQIKVPFFSHTTVVVVVVVVVVEDLIPVERIIGEYKKAITQDREVLQKHLTK